MFINSNPPQFRKAREVAVEVDNFEAIFLDRTSFIDTTDLEQLSYDLLQEALSDPERHHGCLSPALVRRIKEMVESHSVMEPEKRSTLLAD